MDKKFWIKFAVSAAIAAAAIVVFVPFAARIFGIALFEKPTVEKKMPIYSVMTKEPKVGVTFDASWSADGVKEILAALEANGAGATFFVSGLWADKYPEMLEKIHLAGHEIGNHGDRHLHGAQLSFERNKDEIKAADAKVAKLTGVKMKFFRPPFGEYSNAVIEAAEALDYRAVLWDVDSSDWRDLSGEELVENVLNHKNLGNGSIILFHIDGKSTAGAIDAVLKGLKEKGFEIVGLSELIHEGEFYINYEGRQVPIR